MRILHRARPSLMVLTTIVAGLATACGSSPAGPEVPDGEALRPAAHLVCDTPDDLRAAIDALEDDGTLNHGRATALRAKLDQAERWEARGRPDKAAEAYAELIDQLEDWVADGTLAEEDVEDLLHCADDVADGTDVEFATLSSGFAHTCGLTAAGDAYCWGFNLFGQLGDGTNIDSNVPVAVFDGLTFDAISAGGVHTCGLTPTGDAYCWGSNFDGELGDGGFPGRSNVPVAVFGGLFFDAISAGNTHTCGLTAPGDAYCWGNNVSRQLGDGTTNTESNVPVPVVDFGELTFDAISAGGGHTCGVTAAGDAYCWGSNFFGALGAGTITESNVPVAVLGDGLTFDAISAGGQHTCGVTAAGDAYCWGFNSFGELGDDTNTDSNVPVAVTVFDGLTFDPISTGWDHTCGLTPTGDAYCWGNNEFGQLGDGTNMDSNVPVPVASP
ncbi:MAG: FIMAH domain-containing protein [Gemmatimonadota bacterium]